MEGENKDRFLQMICYRACDETGEIALYNLEAGEDVLLSFQVGLTTRFPGGESLLALDTKEWRWERKEMKQVWPSPWKIDKKWEDRPDKCSVIGMGILLGK